MRPIQTVFENPDWDKTLNHALNCGQIEINGHVLISVIGSADGVIEKLLTIIDRYSFSEEDIKDINIIIYNWDFLNLSYYNKVDIGDTAFELVDEDTANESYDGDRILTDDWDIGNQFLEALGIDK